MSILAAIEAHGTTFGHLLEGAPRLLIEQAAPLAAIACGVALISEVIPRLRRVRDRRAGSIANLFGTAEDKIIPIADGVQLWHDSRHRISNDDPSATVPLGAATLRGSYVAKRHGQLHVIAFHSTRGVTLVDDDDGYTDAVSGFIDHATGNVHPAHVLLEIDKDCAQRASLIEAVANTRFGYRGKVVPIVLWDDPEGRAPEPEDERTISSLRPTHYRIENGALTCDRDAPSGLGGFHDDRGFSRLARWLKTQPGRTTPKSRLLLRAAVFCTATWLTAQQPQAWGYEQIQPLATQLRALAVALL